MTLSTHKKVVLFFTLLISFASEGLQAQSPAADTLSKPLADTTESGDDVDELEEIIRYSAQDSVIALPQQGKAILYGKASVDYGSMNIQAEFIEIDYTKNLVIAYGKKDSLGKSAGSPVFKDGSETMEADKIMYNLKSKRGKIYNALTKQGELLVIGNEIKKDSTNIVYMKDMKCIPCQEADARTSFRATRAKIIPDDKIVTGPMYLEVGGVPTPLGLPFGFFPNTKRQHSGILIPTFGTSADRGFNLRQGGFYWGISDKTDMTIRGDIYANGTWAINTLNNYRVLYKANGSVYLSYSKFNIGDPDVPPSFSKQRAYEMRWVHNQDNKSDPSVRFTANVNFVKNQTFNRLNSENSGQYLTNTFNSKVDFTKTFKRSSLSLFGTHSQNAITGDMDITLPSLVYYVNTFFPFKRESAVKQNVLDKLNMSYQLQAQNSLTGKDSTIFKGNMEEKLKYGIKHSIPISTNFNVMKYFVVTPAVNLSSVMYTKSISKDYIPRTRPLMDTLVTNTDRGFAAGYDANFSASLNTKVYFDYLVKGVKRVRHLLIPTLTYGYRPDFGAEQIGFWRKVQVDSTGRRVNYSKFEGAIYGGPEQGKQNSLTLNLNNTLDAKMKQRSDTGVTYNKVTLLQNLTLSSSYNFAADSFQLAPILFAARTVLFKNFDINLNATFDPYGYDNEVGRRVAEFSYNYNDKLLRFTNAYLSVATSFGSNKLAAMRKLRKPELTNGAEKGATPDLNPDEELPWNLSFQYNLTLSNPDNRRIQPTHVLNTTADIKPTKFWKIGVTTGFDFVTQKLSYTSLDIYRDLKCWEATIKWVPFGFNRSYIVGINLKSSMLRDMVPKRQRQTYDNAQLSELMR